MLSNETLEAKLSLVKEFQQFAQAQGLVFEFRHEGRKIECYKNYVPKNKPLYALSIARKMCFPDRPIVSVTFNKAAVEKYLTSYRRLKNKEPDWEHYAMLIHSYFMPGKNPLRPAHLKLSPAQLLCSVAHEGTHATVMHHNYRAIASNLHLSESLAEASSYILLKGFKEASSNVLMNGKMNGNLVEQQLTELEDTHRAIGYWLSEFQTFYSSFEEPLPELEKQRADLFIWMENHFRLIITNPLYLETFDLKLNKGFNNAALAFFASYGIHFKEMLDLYSRCGDFRNFLEGINERAEKTGKRLLFP